MAALVHVTTEDDLDSLIVKNERKLIAIYFEASFADECSQMKPILEQYSKDVDFTNVVIARVDAEKYEPLAAKFGVEMVPSVVFIKNGKTLPDKLSGFNPPELNRLLKKYLDVNFLPSTQSATASNENGGAPELASLENKLRKLINQAPIMLFMKGSPDAPRCGFSRQIVEILRETKCTFGSFDILQDEAVRQGLKEFSKWPTYPQLYVNGELVGGLDIVKELKASGELTSTLFPSA